MLAIDSANVTVSAGVLLTMRFKTDHVHAPCHPVSLSVVRRAGFEVQIPITQAALVTNVLTESLTKCWHFVC